MRVALEAGGDFESLASELSLEIQESGEFGRFGSITGLGSNRRVIDSALALQEGQWGEPVESNLGAVLLALGRKDDALAQFHEALIIDPAHPDARTNLDKIESGSGGLLPN